MSWILRNSSCFCVDIFLIDNLLSLSYCKIMWMRISHYWQAINELMLSPADYLSLWDAAFTNFLDTSLFIFKILIHWTAQVSLNYDFLWLLVWNESWKTIKKTAILRLVFGIYFYDQGSISMQSPGETTALSFLFVSN